jgi:hypothetical protein
MLTGERLRVSLFLIIAAVLALLPRTVQAQTEPSPKPASVARLESLVTKLEGTEMRDLPPSGPVHNDFRSLVQEDPAVLAVLADKIPLCEKPWTTAVLADIVSEADYRQAVPALLRRLRKISGRYRISLKEGYDGLEAVYGALRSLAGPTDVLAIAAALHDEHVPKRRRLMVLLADLDTSEAIAEIQKFLPASGGPEVRYAKDFDSSSEEERAILQAVRRDLSVFNIGYSAPYYLTPGWGYAQRGETSPADPNERHFSLGAAYTGFAVTLRRIHGMWIVTDLEGTWIS